MVNSDYEWLYWQQRFQNAVEGEEVKEMLINNLNNLNHSHSINMRTKTEYFEPIINWDFGDPDNPLPPPPGWIVDENGDWINQHLTEGGNDG